MIRNNIKVLPTLLNAREILKRHLELSQSLRIVIIVLLIGLTISITGNFKQQIKINQLQNANINLQIILSEME